jgi:hypothetical protein
MLRQVVAIFRRSLMPYKLFKQYLCCGNVKSYDPPTTQTLLE